MVKVEELNRDDFIIDDDETVVRITGIEDTNLSNVLEIEYDALGDDLYLIKVANLQETLELEQLNAAFGEQNEDSKEDEDEDEVPKFRSELEKIVFSINPTRKEIEEAGLTPMYVNEAKKSSYEEKYEYIKKVSLIRRKKYLALNEHDREIIDRILMPNVDLTVEGGLNDQVMTELYNLAWERVKKEEDFLRFRQPDLILHEWGEHHLTYGAAAAYNPVIHSVVVGKILWDKIGGHELSEANRAYVIDVFIHEFSHIIHLDHGIEFWELTGRKDSAGEKLRAYKKKRLNDFIKRGKNENKPK